MFDIKWYALLKALLVFRTDINDYSKYQELFNVSNLPADYRAYHKDPRKAWVNTMCFQYKIGVHEYNSIYIYTCLYRLYFNIDNKYDLAILRNFVRRGIHY